MFTALWYLMSGSVDSSPQVSVNAHVKVLSQEIIRINSTEKHYVYNYNLHLEILLLLLLLTGEGSD